MTEVIIQWLIGVLMAGIVAQQGLEVTSIIFWGLMVIGLWLQVGLAYYGE